jgi:hypothetical protein
MSNSYRKDALTIILGSALIKAVADAPDHTKAAGQFILNITKALEMISREKSSESLI